MTRQDQGLNSDISKGCQTMKPLKILSLLLITLLTLGSAHAEDGKRARVKTLLDYQKELSLSAPQVKEIKETLAAYQTVVAQQRKSLMQFEKEYSSLVATRAPIEQIKQKLRQVTDTTYTLRLSDVQTARKVESILSVDQLKKWREMQSKVRKPAS